MGIYQIIDILLKFLQFFFGIAPLPILRFIHIPERNRNLHYSILLSFVYLQTCREGVACRAP
jgi:hypothetical protein